MSRDPNRRWMIFVAGLLGAAGVIAGALAAHAADARIMSAASAMCLAHAPALLALALAGDRVRLSTAAALLLGVGALVFAGDLYAHFLLGRQVLPLAAPVGGTMMILGWVVLAAGALLPARRAGSRSGLPSR